MLDVGEYSRKNNCNLRFNHVTLAYLWNSNQICVVYLAGIETKKWTQTLRFENKISFHLTLRSNEFFSVFSWPNFLSLSAIFIFCLNHAVIRVRSHITISVKIIAFGAILLHSSIIEYIDKVECFLENLSSRENDESISASLGSILLISKNRHFIKSHLEQNIHSNMIRNDYYLQHFAFGSFSMSSNFYWVVHNKLCFIQSTLRFRFAVDFALQLCIKSTIITTDSIFLLTAHHQIARKFIIRKTKGIFLLAMKSIMNLPFLIQNQ